MTTIHNEARAEGNNVIDLHITGIERFTVFHNWTPEKALLFKNRRQWFINPDHHLDTTGHTGYATPAEAIAEEYYMDLADAQLMLWDVAVKDGYYQSEGIIYNRLGRVVSRDILATFAIEWSNEQEVAYAAFTGEVIADYGRRQAERTPEQIAEAQAGALAAHGPGVEMVNVATGERWTT